MASLPQIIQGGMGIGVSSWLLARSVSRVGQLGVVSGTCIDTVLVRRLQDGDVGGALRRAIRQFPLKTVSEYVLTNYFNEKGREPGMPYRLLPMYQRNNKIFRDQITMLASFVEVMLAKEGHTNPVGLNLLTKIQLPNLATIYGAMLADVDFLLMGAGIPREIPAVLEKFMCHEPAALKLDVVDDNSGNVEMLTLDPRNHFVSSAIRHRPKFLPIVSSHALAQMLAKRGGVDGFVVEGPRAGGHNAPPRDRGTNDDGEPVYGKRDEVDLEKMRELKLPFWIAGGISKPEHLQEARSRGAAGVQVGTLFSLAKESGITASIKRTILSLARAGALKIRTDPNASPTGFPFKVVDIPDSVSRDDVYQRRERICDLGYLRSAVRKDDSICFRCPGEPVEDYLRKGGALSDTCGKKCLCNGLLAAVGLGQLRGGEEPEAPLLTSGDQLLEISEFPPARYDEYTSEQVVNYLLQS